MVIGKNRPSMPNDITAVTQLMSEKLRMAKRGSGISGSAWNRSHTTKPTSTKTPAAMISPMVTGPQMAPQS